MPRVYSLKTVSTSDGRCMGVCFCISEEKKIWQRRKKDLLSWRFWLAQRKLNPDLGHFTQIPNIVFSQIPEAPSLRRKLACHPRTFGTKSGCWNSVWNPSVFFPTRDMNNHKPIANRVSFPVVMSNSDMWLKWSFIGHIIYHNMWYKMKRMFPKISLSIVNLGFVCFPNIK